MIFEISYVAIDVARFIQWFLGLRNCIVEYHMLTVWRLEYQEINLDNPNPLATVMDYNFSNVDNNNN